MSRVKNLLPWRQQQPPVLTKDEVAFLLERAEDYQKTATRLMNEGLVSESVIRGRMHAEACIPKLRQSLGREHVDG